MLQKVAVLFKVILAATACKGVSNWRGLKRWPLLMNRATALVAVPLGELLVQILKPVSDLVLSLSNNVSGKLVTAGLYCLVNKHSSSKLAFGPRIIYCMNESTIMPCPKGGLPDRDRGEDSLDASTSISASSREANLLCIWIGSLQLFPDFSPICVLFFGRGNWGFVGWGCCGVQNPIAVHPYPSHPHPRKRSHGNTFL